MKKGGFGGVGCGKGEFLSVWLVFETEKCAGRAKGGLSLAEQRALLTSVAFDEYPGTYKNDSKV